MDDLRSLQQSVYENNVQHSSGAPPTAILLWGLVILAVLQVYTFLQMRQLKASLNQHISSQTDASGALMTDIENRVSVLEGGYRRVLNDERKQGQKDFSAVISRVDSTQDEVKRNTSIVRNLRVQQERSAQELSRKLGTKADVVQVGMLSGNVSATRRDLASTNKKLEKTVAQLGMARSELGTLIARNHSEITKLQELGKRDYFEFTLYHSARPQPVGGVGLRLRKTDAKRLRYALDIYADDYRMQKRGHGINEPIFFYVHASKQPVELVVNDVETDHISGYVSAAKGSMRGWSLRPDPDWEPFQELKRRPAGPESHAAAGLPPSGAVRPN
jgi:hypothetical protein